MDVDTSSTIEQLALLDVSLPTGTFLHGIPERFKWIRPSPVKA